MLLLVPIPQEFLKKMEQNGSGLVRTAKIWPESLPEFSTARRLVSLCISDFTGADPEAMCVETEKCVGGIEAMCSGKIEEGIKPGRF
ncbi:hypothetical protein C1H46_039745 [Malus baccata]|uniref:Uncharacterized protein n=1 Tax=Malus baccata TaxID=106549 RepID=A0A540KKG2_MALBA|nr:hypothetical protein C1H46_039745 [Malus baccata]